MNNFLWLADLWNCPRTHTIFNAQNNLLPKPRTNIFSLMRLPTVYSILYQLSYKPRISFRITRYIKKEMQFFSRYNFQPIIKRIWTNTIIDRPKMIRKTNLRLFPGIYTLTHSSRTYILIKSLTLFNYYELIN